MFQLHTTQLLIFVLIHICTFWLVKYTTIIHAYRDSRNMYYEYWLNDQFNKYSKLPLYEVGYNEMEMFPKSTKCININI